MQCMVIFGCDISMEMVFRNLYENKIFEIERIQMLLVL